MKKILSLILSIITILNVFSIVAYASDNKEICYLSDGSYYTVETTEKISLTRGTTTKQGSRSYHYYNSDDEKEWTITLTATFTYNGSSATCTNSGVSHIIYDDAWKVTSSTASKSGNTATGNFTIKRYVLGIPVKTEKPTITLACSKTGVLS